MEVLIQDKCIKQLFKEFLKEQGYRPTYVKEKMLEVIQTEKEAFSVNELTASMQVKKMNVSKKSVYENIKVLFLFGAVAKTVIKDPVDGLVWKYMSTTDKLIDG